MSTQWYFDTFQYDRFHKICGNATAKQRSDLVGALTDPDEFFDLDEEQLNRRALLANAVLSDGIDYASITNDHALELDEVVRVLFHRMGLGKAFGAKPVSPEPMSLGLAEELARVAGNRRPKSLIPLFDAGGRRFGQSTFSMCNYAIFDRDEIWQLYDDFTSLAEDRSAGWNYPEVPDLIEKNLIPVVEAASKNAELWLHATLT